MTAPSSKFDPVTSPPGKNSHQLGYAFDIQTRYTKIDPKTGKEVNDDSTYQWLLKNAPRIGFVRTVPSERWHWVFKGPNSINTIV
jgi:LAS superfamily LD-carboxypeptidase LdcB